MLSNAIFLSFRENMTKFVFFFSYSLFCSIKSLAILRIQMILFCLNSLLHVSIQRSKYWFIKRPTYLYGNAVRETCIFGTCELSLCHVQFKRSVKHVFRPFWKAGHIQVLLVCTTLIWNYTTQLLLCRQMWFKLGSLIFFRHVFWFPSIFLWFLEELWPFVTFDPEILFTKQIYFQADLI